jgi:hypothetical protein
MSVPAFSAMELPFLVQDPPNSAVFLSVSSLSPEADDYLRNLAATTSFRISVRSGLQLETHVRDVLKLPSIERVFEATKEVIPVPSAQSILHTDRGTFIAVVGSGNDSAFDDRFAVVTLNGTTLSDTKLLTGLRAALPALQELEPVWTAPTAEASPLGYIPRREILSGLITSADWFDYRKPAGTAHFVGRALEMQRAYELVEGTKSGVVLEVKARSGVGKSSLLSVLAETWAAAGHRVELHDARDVQSSEDVLRLIQRFVGKTSRLGRVNTN